MNKNFKPVYYFTVTPHMGDTKIVRLSLIGADPSVFKNGKIRRIPSEIMKIQSWDTPLLFLTHDEFSITGYNNGESGYKDVIKFYGQRDDLLFGECCDTKRAILTRLYGTKDENGILIPAVISLSISNTRFDNINRFNYPTNDHATVWEAALNAKWHRLNAGAKQINN